MHYTLMTDLYQLTMAEGYWHLGMAEREAVFHLTFRTLPFGGGFCIVSGLQSVVEWCHQFRFEGRDLDYLRTLKSPTGDRLFCDDFLHYLGELRFTCDLDAVEEGRVVFPQIPLIRVRGPLIQAQLMETVLLNLINFPTLIATKAARVRLAAGEDTILEFGSRRAQGLNGALAASRAAYIGGCDATSNVLAGQLYDIPLAGTHAHSWVMAFDSEREAFRRYRQAMPHNCLFLVDTYDTLDGVRNAIEVAQEMIQSGESPLGIRLDSGDLCQLSIEARRLLNEAGLEQMQIVASSDLDEYRVKDIKGQGGQVVVWGVGTRLAIGHPEGALDGVYKLSALRDVNGSWMYRAKSSNTPKKASNPGIFQVRRYYSSEGTCQGDVVYDVEYGLSDQARARSVDGTEEWEVPSEGGEELLQPIFRKGEQIYRLRPACELHRRARQELERLPVEARSFTHPSRYFVGIEEGILERRERTLKEAQQ